MRDCVGWMLVDDFAIQPNIQILVQSNSVESVQSCLSTVFTRSGWSASLWRRLASVIAGSSKGKMQSVQLMDGHFDYPILR